MLNTKIILGSTRKNRFSEKPGQWILGEAKKHSDMNVELLDLRDYPMPFLDYDTPPLMLNGKYPNDMAMKWARKIEEGDAFIVVTPEYNHGYSAVLKNAFDMVNKEWNNKPIGFVSYGSVGGARAVEQLRQVVIELQMAPIREMVSIPPNIFMPVWMGKDTSPNPFVSLEAGLPKFFDQLVWWANALKNARDKS
jgi:NAD(P)H-dependent FMN reductase